MTDIDARHEIKLMADTVRTGLQVVKHPRPTYDIYSPDGRLIIVGANEAECYEITAFYPMETSRGGHGEPDILVDYGAGLDMTDAINGGPVLRWIRTRSWELLTPNEGVYPIPGSFRDCETACVLAREILRGLPNGGAA
jgi:hypothetical protein